jgi:hypothetical protein
MLEAPADDDITASSKATRRILGYYMGSYPGTSTLSAQFGSSQVLDFLNTVMSLPFELTAEVAFPSSEHERLVRFVIDIKGLWPQGFSVEVIISALQAFRFVLLNQHRILTLRSSMLL